MKLLLNFIFRVFRVILGISLMLVMFTSLYSFVTKDASRGVFLYNVDNPLSQYKGRIQTYKNKGLFLGDTAFVFKASNPELKIGQMIAYNENDQKMFGNISAINGESMVVSSPLGDKTVPMSQYDGFVFFYIPFFARILHLFTFFIYGFLNFLKSLFTLIYLKLSSI